MAPDNIKLLPIGDLDKNDGGELTSYFYSNLFKTGSRRNRVVYRNWPRDPNGAVISSTSGKSADGGLTIWGATLADFFYTQVIPKRPEFWTISTSSKLLQFSQKTKGEKRHAALQIAEARREENPVEILPFPMEKILRHHDLNDMRRSKAGKSPVHKFHHRVPIHLLPEILHVHDPDTTLAATGRSSTSKRTKPRTYRLHLTDGNVPDKKRVELSESPNRRHGLLLVPDSPVDRPAVFVEYPPRPADPTHTPEASLYLSAASKLGTGNHSHVYNAEWEVPRSWCVQPSVCEDCALEMLLKTLRRANPDVDVDVTLSFEQQIAVLLNFPLSEKLDDNYPFEIIEIHDYKEELKKHPSTPIMVIPIDVAWSAHGYFHQCAHSPPFTDICASRRAKGSPVAISQPTTFKVTVAAKLSIEYDYQLRDEAVNYQRFPEHFFQYWSGYNLVPPFQDSTPCGPIVPQFYGYYLPVREAGEIKYLSPILLLENCGEQIEVETMSFDDRLECASLLRRMDLAGWLHNSIYPRNVVMDYGDLSEDPALHTSSQKKRFRVIDFGRSKNDIRSRLNDEVWNRRKVWEICSIPSSYHQLSVSRRYKNLKKAAEVVEKVDLDIPAIYPVFDLYPAVYPSVKLYPIIPEDVQIRNAILAAQAAAAAIAAAEKAATIKTMYSDFLTSRCVYPVLAVYRSVYPHIELYDTIPQDILERRVRLAAQAVAAALAAAEKAATLEAMYSDFLVSRCTYPVLVIYPSAYPRVDPYPIFPQDIIVQREMLAARAAAKVAAAAEMAATIRTMYSNFLVSCCIYPVLVVYPSAYPHVDPYNVYPQDIIESKAALAAEAAFKLVAAREKTAVLETMALGFHISRCNYPVLIIYPPVYPHAVPYPHLPQDLLPPIISHGETVSNQGSGAALAKLDVVFSAAMALVIGCTAYPHFDLYPPTLEQTPPSPIETDAGSPELEAYAGTTLVGSPSFDMYPSASALPSTPGSPVDSLWSLKMTPESWSSVIYPYFDLYPAMLTSLSSIDNSPLSPANDEFDSSFESSSGYDTGDLLSPDDDDSDSGSATPKLSSARDIGACLTHVAKVVGLRGMMKKELRI